MEEITFKCENDKTTSIFTLYCWLEMSKSDVGKSSVARIMANQPSSEFFE